MELRQEVMWLTVTLSGRTSSVCEVGEGMNGLIMLVTQENTCNLVARNL
jgi:hypothetical protein